jgi:hypothetical protein
MGLENKKPRRLFRRQGCNFEEWEATLHGRNDVSAGRFDGISLAAAKRPHRRGESSPGQEMRRERLDFHWNGEKL